MSKVRRIYVEKKEPYAVAARQLKDDIIGFLAVKGLTGVRKLIRYDVENISDEVFETACRTVFSEPPVDILYHETIEIPENGRVFSVEALPGQFDQRADSAVQCVQFLNENENPVIRTEQLPEGMRASDFRDPKIFRDDDTWYALIVCMDEDGYGNALLYSSKDLKKWTYVNTILKSEDALGRMWECPDIFKMEEKTVMLLSAVEMEATRDFVHHNGHEVLYLVGNYDKEKHEFEPESYGCVDAGLDFYAPQTVEAPDGRRIMIGWIGSWQNAVTPKELPFNGMMSVPRELSVRDGRLYQTPVREIENYYTDTVERTAIIGMKKVMLEDVEGRIADIEMEIRGRDFDTFTICIAENDRYETVINYDKRDRLLTFDRLFSGNRKDSLNMRTMPVTAEKELFRLRIILDRYSVEIFADDGAEVMTSTIFTPLEADGISFVCDGRAELSVVKHGIRVDQE